MIKIYNIMLFIDSITRGTDKESLISIYNCKESIEISFSNYICKIKKEENNFKFNFRRKKTLLYSNFELTNEEFNSFKNDLQEVFL